MIYRNGDLLDIILTILYLLSFLVLYQFLGYPSIMALIALKGKKGHVKDYTFEPYVSIIAPTFNEERVIKRKIENLLSINYPKDKYEILIIDSGSIDGTVKIIKDMGQQHDNHPRLRLITEEERKGKVSAVNLGNKYACGDVVLITDANSIFDKDVLKEITPHFKNPDVGAVSGRYLISNPDNILTGSEDFYWQIEHINMLGESYLDSISTVIGTISAWKKDLMNFRSTTITEDLDMTIQVRRKGYRVKYEPEAKVYEPSATTPEDQIKQRRRTSTGTIQNIFRHLDYLILPRNLHSLFIFPSHKVLPMFSPFILLGILILYVAVWDIAVVATHFVATSIVFSGLLVLLLYLKSKIIGHMAQESVFSISMVPKIVYYVLLNEYLILLAWGDFIFRRHSVLWERAESTRGVE